MESEMSNDWRTSEGQWIDPYATKRNKNFRYNKRKEQRRIERIQKIEEAIVKGIELESDSSSEEETMWK